MLACCLLMLDCEPARAADAGVPLRDLLAALAHSGVQLIYSSETVTPELRAVAPAASLPVQEQLRQLLAPLGLEARGLPTGGYVIVRRPGPAAADLEVTVTLATAGRGSALPGAEVILRGTAERARTDAAGRARFTGLAPGSYAVEVRADGLRSLRRRVSVPGGQAVTRMALRMQWDGEHLEEISITGNRYDAGATPGVAVSRELLAHIPISADDAVRAMQGLPGTAVAGYSARTHVRGSREDETLFRYDGLTLTDPYHLEDLQGLLGVIDPAIIETATIWTGLAPIQFSNRIGGVIDFEPRVIRAATLEGKVSNRGLGVLAGTPFARMRGTVFTAARFRNTNSPALWLDSEGDALRVRDFIAHASWNARPDMRLVAGLLLVDDQRTALTSEIGVVEQNALHRATERYAWLRLILDPLPWLHAETLVSRESSEEQLEGAVDLPGIESGSLAKFARDAAVSLRQEFELRHEPGWTFLLGAEQTRATVSEIYSSRAAYSPPFVPALQPAAQLQVDSNTSLHAVADAAYVAIRWQPGPRSLADFGLRRDARRYGGAAPGDSEWGGQANYRLRLAGGLTARVGWGQSVQAEYFDVTRAADGSVLPAPARRLAQWNFGLERSFAGRWYLRAALYDKREQSAFAWRENLFTPFALLPDIALGNQPFAGDGARMRGLELHVESDRARAVSAWLNYTHSRAEDRIAGRWVRRSWDQPDALQLGVNWQRRPWRASGSWTWHSGWPYTPLLVSRSVWQDPSQVTVALAPRNSARLPAFESLDLRVGWEKSFNRDTFQVTLELDDLTDTRVRCCRNYAVATLPDGSSQLIDNPGYWQAFAPALEFSWTH